MSQNPPLPDPEGYDGGTYEYESDEEELLGESARALFRHTGGNYRCELFLEPHARCLTGFQGHEPHCLRTTGKQVLFSLIPVSSGQNHLVQARFNISPLSISCDLIN